MTKFLVFTNIYNKPSNKRYFQNQNRFKTFYAESKEEVKSIIEEVKKSGYTVTKVTTALGTRISVDR